MRNINTCEITGCTRCQVGICELSQLDPDDYRYRNKNKCSHRDFILRERRLRG